MDAKTLIGLRKQAEKMVADMADGDLKLKAFEVILSRLLLSAEPVRGSDESREGKGSPPKQSGVMPPAKSVPGRILLMQAEGFFKGQKAIGEIREELGTHGWHYNLSNLSGPLQKLVQQRRLRRVRVKEGKKKVYKYSDP